MREVYRNIKKLRREKGLSQDELAKMTGYSDRSAVSKIEAGKVDLPLIKVRIFAKALGVDPLDLMGEDWSDYSEADKERTDRMVVQESIVPYGSNVKGVYPVSVQRVPMLGEIACGEPITANQVNDVYVQTGTSVKCDFCLKARGDSMIGARIQDGDIVFIHEQPTVENGEIAAVVIDDEATLKRFYAYENKIVLQAENPKYEPIVYIGEETEHVRILGKAVSFQSDINRP